MIQISTKDNQFGYKGKEHDVNDWLLKSVWALEINNFNKLKNHAKISSFVKILNLGPVFSDWKLQTDLCIIAVNIDQNIVSIVSI